MKVKVYLAKEEIIRDSLFYKQDSKIFSGQLLRHALSDGKYELAGEVEAADLEDAFAKTQNIDAPWNKEKPCRSVSVGDVLVVDNIVHAVGSFGFDDLGRF